MKRIVILFLSFCMICFLHAQKVGIGTNAPAAKLDIIGSPNSPTIPGLLSTGILRIGVGNDEAVDIGKMQNFPFSGWIQAGYSNTTPDPLSLQPVGGNVGIGINNPNGSAALDINSSIRGFLPPRMSKTNRNNIVNPVAGLMIWCENCGQFGEIQVYNGGFWTNMTGGLPSGLMIGDTYGGGKVAYIFQPGDPGYVAGQVHGLIAAPNDLGTGFQWGCYGETLPGADGLILGTGNQNTIDIINGCPTAGIAAKQCADLTLGGYSDWYLPSKDELYQLYLNRVAIGGFNLTKTYWSSSETNYEYAYSQYFSTSAQGNAIKNNTEIYVRPIRSF